MYSAPGEAVMNQCKQNLEAGLRPIVVTLFDKLAMARGNAEALGIETQVDVFPIEQFLTINIYEHSKFEQELQRRALTQIIDKYNLIIDACETDPSLKIVIG